MSGETEVSHREAREGIEFSTSEFDFKLILHVIGLNVHVCVKWLKITEALLQVGVLFGTEACWELCFNVTGSGNLEGFTVEEWYEKKFIDIYIEGNQIILPARLIFKIIMEFKV